MHAVETDELVADGRHHGNEQDAGNDPPFHFGAAQESEHHYGNQDDGKEEGGAAPGVGRIKLAYVFYRQGQARLVGVDRHVFCAVVGEYPLNILHQPDAAHVAQQDNQADRPLNQVADQVRLNKGVHQAHCQQGQNEENAHAQDEGNGECGGQQPVGYLFPVALLIGGGQGGGPVQGLNSKDKGLDQYQYSPQEGDAPDGAVEGGVQALMIVEYVPVGAAHSQAVVFASANHNSFDDCLSAVGGSWLFRHCPLPFKACGEMAARTALSQQAEGDHKKGIEGLVNSPRFCR